MDIVVSQARLVKLLQDESLLEKLRSNGVDNWCGWGEWEDEDEGERHSEYSERLEEMTSQELQYEVNR